MFLIPRKQTTNSHQPYNEGIQWILVMVAGSILMPNSHAILIVTSAQLTSHKYNIIYDGCFQQMI